MEPSNTKDLELFLTNNSIKELTNFTTKKAQKTDIQALAREYFKTPTSNHEKDELKVKSWFLLSESSLTKESGAFLSTLKLSPALKKEILKGSTRKGEEWRISHLANMGIDVDTHADKILALACEQGNKHLVKSLLQKRVNIHLTDKYRNTLLHKAADDPKIGALLIRAGIFVDSKNYRDETPLHRACIDGNYHLAYRLIQMGANLEAKNKEGSTPLHLAFQNGHIKIGARLIEEGATIFSYDHKLRGPLDYLRESDYKSALGFLKDYCHKNKIDLLSAAIEFGFDDYAISLYKEMEEEYYLGPFLNEFDKDDLTPLLRAASHHPPNLKLIKFLINKGADINLRNSQGESPLLNVIKQRPIDLDILTFLKKKGADFSQVNSSGQTALHLAVFSLPHQGEVIDFLIKEGQIDVNSQDNTGATALHLACSSPQPSPEFIKVFLNNRADVSLEDKKGRTPLEAVSMSFAPSQGVVDQLLNAGARFDIVSRKKHIKISTLLKMKGLSLPSQETKEYDEEYILRTLLVASWGITKHLTTMGDHSIDLEGGYHEIAQSQNRELLKMFNEQTGASLDRDKVLETIERGYEAGHKDPTEISKLFKEGKPLIFITGWHKHAISVVFYGDYLLICNRGDYQKASSVKVFKIHRKSFELSKENIGYLQRGNFPTSKAGATFFYKTLPNSLGYKKGEFDLIVSSIERKCDQSEQKTGNCWWLGPKSADMALIMIKSLVDQEPTSDVITQVKAYRQSLDSGDTIYKHFSEFGRLALLKKYIKRPDDAIPRDHELIKKIDKKLHSKKWKLIFENQSPAVISSFNNLTGPSKQDLPLFTREEVTEWFSQYREMYRLNEEYEPAAA